MNLVHIQKKRESLYLLLIPRIEAFALPKPSERATQTPTPIWNKQNKYA